MSHPFIVFVVATGEILRTGAVSEPMDLPNQVKPGEDWMMTTANDETEYVNPETGRIALRPELDLPESIVLTTGETFATTEIPVGSKVSLDGHRSVTIDEDGLEFTPIAAGRHFLRIQSAFPYRHHTIRITVND